tara:strand:- start:137 stop:322 length:186 start_codon:yes stop_codon:yes gene_type:complete
MLNLLAYLIVTLSVLVVIVFGIFSIVYAHQDHKKLVLEIKSEMKDYVIEAVYAQGKKEGGK